jgi:hypothetical protein
MRIRTVILASGLVFQRGNSDQYRAVDPEKDATYEYRERKLGVIPYDFSKHWEAVWPH